jgi:cation diffusion facilitator family transporter
MNIINFKKIKQVLWIIMFANLAVALLKIFIGSAVKSASMTADGFHSLTDGSSNIIGLIGISLAVKPMDKDHPYGHKKFETLAGLFIAGMLLVIGGKIIIDAISRFLNPAALHITFDSLITLLVTLGINIFVCTYEYNKGKKLNSYILLSDSLHTRSDIYVSIGVLVTLICVKLGLPPIIDPIASLIVSIFILHASYEIFKSAGSILVDKAVIDTEKVKDLTLEFEQVKGVHNIRSRGSEDDVYIDMHILTEPNMSVEKSHDLIHAIETKMRNEINDNLQVFVHLEPFYKKINNNN